MPWFISKDALNKLSAWSLDEMNALLQLCDEYLDVHIQAFGNDSAHRAEPSAEFPFPHKLWVCVDDPASHVITTVYECPFVGARDTRSWCAVEPEILYHQMCTGVEFTDDGPLIGNLNGRKVKAVQIDAWRETKIFRLDYVVESLTCDECYGSGFYRGIGRPCSKGCPPKG